MGTPILLFSFVVQTVIGLCAVGLTLYFVYVFFTMPRELPYVPTPYNVIRRMIALAAIQPNDRVVDFGSGTGRIALEVTRQFPVTVIGVERSPLLLFAAKLRQMCTWKRGKVIWKQEDFFTYPLHDTTVVFCFLVTSVLERLASRFATLPKGARVVSYKFRAPLSEGWESHVAWIGRGGYDAIYMYVKKT